MKCRGLFVATLYQAFFSSPKSRVSRSILHQQLPCCCQSHLLYSMQRQKCSPHNSVVQREEDQLTYWKWKTHSKVFLIFKSIIFFFETYCRWWGSCWCWCRCLSSNIFCIAQATSITWAVYWNLLSELLFFSFSAGFRFISSETCRGCLQLIPARDSSNNLSSFLLSTASFLHDFSCWCHQFSKRHFFSANAL